jgi:Ca2+-binding EF-hand superfamily protein
MMSSSSNITADVLIGIIRDQCLHKGQNGIRGLSMVFRKMDIDFSKGIVYAELRIAIERYGLHMSEGYLSTLFHALDEDNNGWIDFAEFMRALRSPLNDRRVGVIMEVFDHIDVNNDGVLSIEDLKGKNNDVDIKILLSLRSETFQ